MPVPTTYKEKKKKKHSFGQVGEGHDGPRRLSGALASRSIVDWLPDASLRGDLVCAV